MKIRFAMAALAATFFVVVPSAVAQKPVISGTPAIFVGGPEGTGAWSPPAVPHIGDTLYSSTPSAHCDPSCDPNNPDADPKVGNREVFYGTPPAGYAYQFEKCDGPDHCVVVQAKSTKNTYVVQSTDAGWMLRVVFMATNLDCAYPRSYDNYQHCGWDTESVPSVMTPAVPVVAIDPGTLPDGVVTGPYSVTLSASNGTGPYSFSVTSGTLPPGITLSQSGALTGTPTKGGTFAFTVQATSSGAGPGTRAYTIKVGLVLAPTSALLPGGTTGVAYSQPLTATGSNPPVAWTITGGALPPGITLGADGVVTGAPTQKGDFTFRATATDSAGATGSRTYTMSIGWPTLVASPPVLPPAVRRVAYQGNLGVSGGSAPYSFAQMSGSLPAGLTLGADGTITGVPTGAPGTFEFQVTVTDHFGAQATLAYRLAYFAPTIVIGPARLGPAQTGRAFQAQLSAKGGSGPYRFDVESGRLPKGIALHANGVLAGVPKQAATYRFKVRATDVHGAFETRSFVLVIKR